MTRADRQASPRRLGAARIQWTMSRRAGWQHERRRQLQLHPRPQRMTRSGLWVIGSLRPSCQSSCKACSRCAPVLGLKKAATPESARCSCDWFFTSTLIASQMYDDRVRKLGRKPIVAISDRPEAALCVAFASIAGKCKAAIARRKELTCSNFDLPFDRCCRSRARKITDTERIAAKAVTVAPASEQRASEGSGAKSATAETKASNTRGRRKNNSSSSSPAATGHATPAGVSTGKYDLQCFRCLQRPPSHTAFVYVSELMR